PGPDLRSAPAAIPSGRMVLIPVASSAKPAVAPAPPAAAKPAPAPAHAPAPAAPAPVISPAVAEEAAKNAAEQKRPGAWAGNLTLHQSKAKTKYLAPSTFKEMMGNAAATGPVPMLETNEPCLQVISGARASEIVELLAGEAGLSEWSVGSDKQRDVFLPDQGVSALHARIVNEGQRWKVVDQMSAN